MSYRSFRIVIARLTALVLASIVSLGCASAVGTTPQAAAPPPPATTAADCQRQAQAGQPASKDCAKTP